MTTKSIESGQSLRQLAEERVMSEIHLPQGALSPKQIGQELYELRVNQIELLIQQEELLRVQQELEASKASYFELYELAPVGYLSMNDQGLILKANLTAATLIGMVKKNLINNKLTNFIYREDQDIFYLNRKYVLEKSGSKEWEMRLINSDGSPIWMQVHAKKENTNTLLLTFSNITDRKRAEDALCQSEKRYKNIVESQTEFVDRFLPGGILTYVNPALARFTGVKAEALYGQSFYDFVHKDTRESCIRLIESISREKPSVDTESRIDLQDGTTHWIRWSQTGIFDEHGKLIEYQAVGKDITEQRVTEDRLRESEQKYRLMIECAGDSISVMDLQGNLLEVNPFACRMLGYSYDELTSLSADKIDARPEEIPKNAIKLMETGYYYGETEFVRKNGATVPVSIDARKILWEGHPAILSICRDMTEQKKSEEKRLQLEKELLHAQKLESLGIMAGGIAHDFNNLLHSILGDMELAKLTLDSDSVSQQHISCAMSSARRAANLTNLMLTYSGKRVVTKTDLNLNNIARENVDLLKIGTTAAIEIELSLSIELPGIYANGAQIQQVVMNLITNSAESIDKPRGRVKITTGIKNCDLNYLSTSLLDIKVKEGTYVFLEVEDNGCGMTEETLKRIFDPFFSTKFTGRGLGMSAVMGILKSHSGGLIVKSEFGKGTTFRVLFPVSETYSPAKANPPDASPNVHCTVQGNTFSGVVLVVDDEKNVLRTCAKMVEFTGFQVITARDGLDAIAKYREHQEEIILVVMDLTMPNMDGLTAMAKIHDIRPDIKVILSSGFSEEELCERINGITPSGIIQKPYTLKLLQAEIRRVLQADQVINHDAPLCCRVS